MNRLKERIRQEGIVQEGNILKVDSFLNHQIDPVLMMDMGREFADRFADAQITKVLTIESSGIAIALTTALQLHVPLVFARKKRSELMKEEVFVTHIYSFTKKETSEVSVLRRFIGPGERILIIDDFLANGEAALGLADIVKQAGASVVGIGIVIEKAFQPGGQKIAEAGIRLESLAKIQSFQNGEVVFA